MNAVKRIFTTVVFAFLVAGMSNQVQAQGQQRQRPPQGQGQRPQVDAKKMLQEQMKWFKENFDLTVDQTKMIEEIQKADSEKRKQVMEAGLTPRDTEFREKMEGIDITRDAELKEILNSEQWTIFEKRKEEFKAIGRPERPQRQGKNG